MAPVPQASGIHTWEDSGSEGRDGDQEKNRTGPLCPCGNKQGSLPGKSQWEVLLEMRPRGGPRAESPGQGLHLPKDALRHVAREGRQHRGHPQRAHPLHDPVLGERREGAGGEREAPTFPRGDPGRCRTSGWAGVGGCPRLREGSLGQEDQGVTGLCPGRAGPPPVPAGRAA